MLKVLLIALVFVNLNPKTEWKLKKNKAEIEVYTRKVEGSSFEEFKAITTIENSSLENVLDVIMDVANYDNLFPDCEQMKVLKQDGKYYDIHYFVVKAPWPLKPRDAIYEQIATLSNNGKSAKIVLEPKPNFIDIKKDFIRMRSSSGFWELEEDANRTVKVIYQFHPEPEGKVPAWLANSFVVSHPFQVLVNLKNRLKK
jgi:hypothetical protein